MNCATHLLLLLYKQPKHAFLPCTWKGIRGYKFPNSCYSSHTGRSENKSMATYLPGLSSRSVRCFWLAVVFWACVSLYLLLLLCVCVLYFPGITPLLSLLLSLSLWECVLVGQTLHNQMSQSVCVWERMGAEERQGGERERSCRHINGGISP